jgi:hypothetical protein
MDTCKDCADCVTRTTEKRGKKPIIKHYCQSRSLDRKGVEMACMLFREKAV